MKALNSVQDLWAHCRFCPICQDMCRDVTIDVGPDDVFTISSFEKQDHILRLECTFRAKKQRYRTVYSVNCLDNTFKVDISEPVHESASSDSYKRNDRASAPYFFFYIFSDCKKCNSAHTNSSDLELDLLERKVSNIGIEREGVYLLTEKDKFHISLFYDRNVMLVSRAREEDSVIVDDDKHVELPLVNLDFSNPNKVINKIKTLILFS